MPTVFVAGATGYLGRFLVQTYTAQGWQVRALVRDVARATDLAGANVTLVAAEATQPERLHGVMDGVDLVVSSLGITRQRDGLSYHDVDYQANVNLLNEALRAGVPRFAYVHVLGARRMGHVALVAAKEAFVAALRAAPIASTVIAPSGYFSDMADFMEMARKGRVWLFGSGQNRINPIHGADLAEAIFDACASGVDHLDVGGPDVLTHQDIAELAFAALGRPARITRLPDWMRRAVIACLPLAPRHIRGPAAFFLTAMGMDMAAKQVGTRHLKAHFESLAQGA